MQSYFAVMASSEGCIPETPSVLVLVFQLASALLGLSLQTRVCSDKTKRGGGQTQGRENIP